MVIDDENREKILLKYQALEPLFNERTRRVWAATEAMALGYGGVTAVAEALNMSRLTIHKGIEEIRQGLTLEDSDRLRKKGAGRPPLTEQDPGLLSALEGLIEPSVRGDPSSPLRWTSKSQVRLSEELTAMGHPVSPRKVGYLLNEMGYSLKGTAKTAEGSQHPDRDKQFEHINRRCQEMMDRGQPVISVDTKKKELVGDFSNEGREWQPKGKPERVNVHNFPSDAIGKAIPYGIYDIFVNTGWVNVGIDHDTAEFAVSSIRRWWNEMGVYCYPDATELLITADAGGSNGYRVRMWKLALSKLAEETGLKIDVCHYPPGTSKWNKIEHRLFSHITKNWRGRPLRSFEAVVNLIANTSTNAGLEVWSSMDINKYETKKKVSEEKFDEINLVRDDFHGLWNYSIIPTIQYS